MRMNTNRNTFMFKKSGDFAKIDLKTLKVTKNYLKPADLKKAIEIVKMNKEAFERQWDEYFRGQ